MSLEVEDAIPIKENLTEGAETLGIESSKMFQDIKGTFEKYRTELLVGGGLIALWYLMNPSKKSKPKKE